MESVIITKQGTKLSFQNIDKISESLSRDPRDIVSFLKKHFATSFDYKIGVATTTKKDLTKPMLQNAVYQYIEDFILCKKCKLPETFVFTDKKKISIVCNACSFKISC
jgi:translation initiation factor 2 beta subunit (eIF-2beta)/eIF-5